VRRVPSFVYGHVIGAAITGAIGGAFLDLTAVLVFSTGLAAAAAASALICWWWPTFDAPAWKLWLAATAANPVMVAGLTWSIVMRDCLTGELTGWNCLFAEVGLVACAGTLPSPIVGLIVRWFWARRRRTRLRPPGPAGP
jgi:hypothetical protein